MLLKLADILLSSKILQNAFYFFKSNSVFGSIDIKVKQFGRVGTNLLLIANKFSLQESDFRRFFRQAGSTLTKFYSKLLSNFL